MEFSLQHFDGERYELGEFIVMPNHVHAIVATIGGHQLSAILHSWKSFSAKRIAASYTASSSAFVGWALVMRIVGSTLMGFTPGAGALLMVGPLKGSPGAGALDLA